MLVMNKELKEQNITERVCNGRCYELQTEALFGFLELCGKSGGSVEVEGPFIVSVMCVFSMGFFAGSLQGSLAVRRGVLCRVLARFPMGFISEFSQGFSVVLRPSGVGVLQGSLGGSPGSPWDSLLSQGFPQGSRPSLEYLHLESTRLPPNF